MENKLVSKLYSSLNKDGYHISNSMTDKNITTCLHYHDYYEIMIYLGTSPMTAYIGNQKYQINCGDIAVINIFESHQFIGNTLSTNERICIGIDTEILLSFSPENNNLLNIFNPQNSSYPILRTDIWNMQKYFYILESLKNTTPNHGVHIFRRALLLQLLAYLYNDSYDGQKLNTQKDKNIEIVSKIVRYIEHHLSEDITLSDLAREVNYSVSYISKIFKSITNQSLTKYIVNKRILHACYLLQGSLPITSVAEMTGFHNYSYFFKVFRKINGMSPTEYKTKYQSEKHI